MVQGVTFRIELPPLKTGNYSASDGTIVKTKNENNNVILYLSTDVAAHATKEIIIEPEAPREMMVVSLPHKPVEGKISFSIKDTKGKVLQNAEIIIDSKYYQPDAKGNVNVDLKRGVHKVQIQSPGYEPFISTFNVKGRIYLIQQLFGMGS
jgi:hypothetical protein